MTVSTRSMLVLGATLAAVVWWAIATGVPLAILITLVTLATACIALWQIDVQQHRLPNAVVYPLYPVVALGLVAGGITLDDFPLASVLGAIGVWTAVFAGIHVITGGRGMGLGDVKLAPVLAAALGWFGWGPAIVGLLAAFTFGGAVSAILLLRGSERHRAIAFGPFMILGAAAGLLCGTTVGQWYLTVA